MEIYPSTHPNIERYSSVISGYTGLARNMKFPYWVWVNEEKPIGLVIVGKEPIRMFAPAGTKMAIVEMIDTKQIGVNLDRFIEEVKHLSARHNAEYITANLPFEEIDAVRSLQKYGFKILADSYQMVCQLNREFSDYTHLQFVQAKKEDSRKWAKQAEQFLKGSRDTVLELGLRHILDLPEEFIDLVLKSETFFFVTKDNEAFGVLEINKERGTISNVGVRPSERNRGYGRQIVTFGLRQLRASNNKEARLRVHVANDNAIHLYKSIGFQVKQRNLTLLWSQGDRIATL